MAGTDPCGHDHKFLEGSSTVNLGNQGHVTQPHRSQIPVFEFQGQRYAQHKYMASAARSRLMLRLPAGAETPFSLSRDPT
jgi:hypothetical protein